MKHAAYVLAALVTALAWAGGASGQQQTFYSAKAAPKSPPRATAQPINPDYLYYACAGSRSKQRGCGRRPSPHPSPRPRYRPAPRHT